MSSAGKKLARLKRAFLIPGIRYTIPRKHSQLFEHNE